MSLEGGYCRLCLTCNNLVPIFHNGKELANKISLLCSVDIKSNDNLSTKICSNCKERIETWDIFLQLCYRNQGLIIREETSEDVTCIDVEEPLCMDDSMSGAEIDVSEATQEVQTLTSNSTDGINFSADFHVDQNLSLRNVSANFGVSYELQDETIQKLSEEEQRKIFNCKLCPRNFNSQHAVNAHHGWHKRLTNESLKAVITKKPKKTPEKQNKPKFVCSHCYFVLPNDKALKAHVLRFHGNMAAYLIPSCETCNQDFATISEYENHKKLHEIVELQKKLVTFPCQYCSASFNKDETLQSHIRLSHAEVFQEYKCDHCGKAFGKHASLTNHVKVHEKQKAVVGTPKPLFVCSICNMGFHTPKELKTHTLKAHPF